MNIETRSGWHAGGTCAPCTRARGGSPTEIWPWDATEAVPYRATATVLSEAKALFRGALGSPGSVLARSGTTCPVFSTGRGDYVRGRRRGCPPEPLSRDCVGA